VSRYWPWIQVTSFVNQIKKANQMGIRYNDAIDTNRRPRWGHFQNVIKLATGRKLLTKLKIVAPEELPFVEI
jgi:hypothetical protein